MITFRLADLTTDPGVLTSTEELYALSAQVQDGALSLALLAQVEALEVGMSHLRRAAGPLSATPGER